MDRMRRVALPLRWSDPGRPDYKDFDSITKEQQDHVIMAVISFPYFLHKVFMPWFSVAEIKPWPAVLWPHCRRMAQRYQRALHPDLLPFDVFPEERGTHWRVGTVAPNRSLKSTVTSEALPLWLIGGWPEGIRIIGETSKGDLGDRHIQVCKENITSSKYYRSVYGSLYHKEYGKMWRSDTFSVDAMSRAADQTMTFVGEGSSIEGSGGDIGILDDVQSYANAMSPNVRANQWQWANQVIIGRLDPHARALFFIGTRQADDDFAGRIQEENKATNSWDYEETPAILPPWPPADEDFVDPTLPPDRLYKPENLVDIDEWSSRLLCEDLHSVKSLMEEYAPETARVAFARTRLNLVRDPASKWFGLETVLKGMCRADGGKREDELRRPRLPAWSVHEGVPERGTKLFDIYETQGVHIDKRVISIDTAATKERPGQDPDYTVLALWGMDLKTNARVCLDIERFRTGSPSVFRRRLAVWASAYKPHVIVMETNAMAIWIAKDAQAEIGVPIKPYQRGKADLEKLEQFKSLAESGMLLYCWGDRRSERVMGPFEQELDAYPDGSHDDTLDTAVMAQDYLKPRGYKIKAVTSDEVSQYGYQQERKEHLVGGIEEAKNELASLLEKLDAYV
jgi:phage terminase large subunit-like protein